MRKIIALSVAIMALLLPFRGEAVHIRNLDKVPHTLTIENIGDSRSITIAPGESYTTYNVSPTLSLEGGNSVSAFSREQFIIYHNKLHIQRRNPRKGSLR